MRVFLQPAYVLHTRPYRDSSLLVELFGAEHGRVSLLAKGVRSRRGGPSRGGAALWQPFVPLLCSWSGRSSLRTATGCEPRSSALALRGRRIFCGLYVNELMDRLMHHDDPHPRLFYFYEQTLSQLCEVEDFEPVLRQFEFRLLEELGYGFELSVDGLSGGPVEASRQYLFHHEHGLIQAADRVAGGATFQGEDLLKLGDGVFDTSSRHCAKRLMRAALAGRLGEKPLKSRELFGAGGDNG